MGLRYLRYPSVSDVRNVTAALADALAALRIDEFAWSVFAAHATIGFEVGLPFLRLYGDVRFLLPLSHGESWWGVQVGGFAGLLGFAILF